MMEERILYAVLFLAEALITWAYYEYLFSRRKSVAFIFFSFVMGYSILYIVSQLGRTNLNAICFCIINFLLLTINYQCGSKTGLFHAAFLCFIMLISEVLVALLISLFGHEFAAYEYNFSVMVVLVVLSKLLYLVFSIIGSRIFAPHKNTGEEPHLMILFCSLPLLSAVLAIIIIYIGSYSEMTRTSGVMMVMIVFTLLVVNLILMVLYNHLQKSNMEQLTLQLSIQQEKADTVYYGALQEQFENQRILVHDIKNHLRTIEGLAVQGKANEIVLYVNRLDNDLLQSKQARLSTDPILNMLLIRFCDDCETNNIDFQCDIRDNSVSFMDPPSVTTLFGNLLSNAMEAAMLSREKYIELSVIPKIGQEAITVTLINSCDVAPVPDSQGRFLSMKKDKSVHGVGLKSIDRVVRKYNGIATMYYDSDGKKFHHVIQFSPQ